MQHWALILLAVLGAANVSAATFVNTTVIASSNRAVESRTFSEPGILGWSDSIQSGQSSAFAQANLETGTLRVRANADIAYYTDFGQASAWVRDTVTFQDWTGQPVRLYWYFHSSVSANYPNAVYYAPSSAEFQIRVNDQVVEYDGIDNSGAYFNGGTVEKVGWIEWSSNPGPITLLLLLSAQAQGPGEWIDAGNTARFYLQLPAGVSYTSTSGVFLADVAPITPIPEPTSALLLVAGTLVVLARARRRVH